MNAFHPSESGRVIDRATLMMLSIFSLRTTDPSATAFSHACISNGHLCHVTKRRRFVKSHSGAQFQSPEKPYTRTPGTVTPRRKLSKEP